MQSTEAGDSYVSHVAELERRLDADAALQSAVGGEFVAIGKLEYQLLRSLGLRDGHAVVDVGCGSGRLACQLAAFPQIQYMGCDVVPRLLSYARELCRRPDWEFIHTQGTAIPWPDNKSDFVCFFSVFTHLTHEDTFRYIVEAHRVLKAGGLLVMSFLEFGIPGHWDTFVASVNRTRENSHLNQFFGREAIAAWAKHAGFRVVAIHGGDTSYIPLSDPVTYDNGTVVSGSASLGQSLAILQKTERNSLPRSAAPLMNVSVRGVVSPPDSVCVGFVVGGTKAAKLLVRAVGPSLASFGVSATVQRPTFVVRDATSALSEHSGWRDDEGLRRLFADVGAFPLLAQSSDAAAVITLPPGSYSILARGADVTDAGELLVEVYYVE